MNRRESVKVSVSRIILVEGDANDPRFYLKEGKEIGVVRSIKFFERYLETPGLLRVPRAFRVNPNYVKAYNSEQGVLTMSNGQTANVARRRKSILTALMA